MLDITKTYIVPMSRECNEDTIEELTECRLELFGKRKENVRVIAIEPGFRIKRFVADHFEFLIYSKYATIVEE